MRGDSNADARQCQAVRELIEWPRHGERRLVQGLPRRDLRRRRLATADVAPDLATPTPPSSTGPRGVFAGSASGSSSRTGGCRTGCDPSACCGGLRRATAVLPHGRPGHHSQALDSRATPSRRNARLGVVVDRAARRRAAAVRHHHRHRRLHRQRSRQPQLLRSPHPHLPRLRRRPRLRARDRREGQRAGGAAHRAGAAVVEGRARGARDEHRSVPVGRGPLQADAGHLGGVPRLRQPLLGAHQVAAAAARPSAAARDRRGGADHRQPVGARRSTRRPGAPPSRTRPTRARGSRRWRSSTAPASPPAF